MFDNRTIYFKSSTIQNNSFIHLIADLWWIVPLVLKNVFIVCFIVIRECKKVYMLNIDYISLIHSRSPLLKCLFFIEKNYHKIHLIVFLLMATSWYCFKCSSIPFISCHLDRFRSLDRVSFLLFCFGFFWGKNWNNS